MRILLVISLILVTGNIKGQVLGRFYYNRNWELTARDSSEFFRVCIFDTVRNTFAGQIRDFDKNGKLLMTGAYKGGMRDGHFIHYSANQQVLLEGDYNGGLRTGTWTKYYPSGKQMYQVVFVADKAVIKFLNDSLGSPILKDGTGHWKEQYQEYKSPDRIVEGDLKDHVREGAWSLRDVHGRMIRQEHYKNGSMSDKTNYDEKGKKINEMFESSHPIEMLMDHFKFRITEELTIVEGITGDQYPFLKKVLPIGQNELNNLKSSLNEEIFTVVELPAEPYGGMRKFYETIAALIKYPEKARRMRIEGKVFIEFIVNIDGSLSDFKIVTGVDQLDEEALRIIKEYASTHRWLPGRMPSGRPVRQRYTLPIIFRIG
ncbi:MAG: TonB family protein [Bacteroidetes bacterium]|nr:TonB family protein [Bacteroidota bacterium]